jgi:hypothetical protein
MPGSVFHDLFELWQQRARQDEYIGTLINAYLAGGGSALGVRAGQAYVDVGTLHGYRHAMHLLSEGSMTGDVLRLARHAASAPPGQHIVDSPNRQHDPA